VCRARGSSHLITPSSHPPPSPQVFFLTPDAADDTPLFCNKAIDRALPVVWSGV
jgi:hypothetical protein